MYGGESDEASPRTTGCDEKLTKVDGHTLPDEGIKTLLLLLSNEDAGLPENEPTQKDT